MTIYTIGFTKKSASQFFEALRHSGAKHLLDIRLHNTSQLAGFTKRDDLRYFLKQILVIDYHEMPLLAPDDSLLREYRMTGDWPSYEKGYHQLIRSRQVENHIDPKLCQEGIILLCSEPTADRCHRRLAAEYLANSVLAGYAIRHL